MFWSKPHKRTKACDLLKGWIIFHMMKSWGARVQWVFVIFIAMVTGLAEKSNSAKFPIGRKQQDRFFSGVFLKVQEELRRKKMYGRIKGELQNSSQETCECVPDLWSTPKGQFCTAAQSIIRFPWVSVWCTWIFMGTCPVVLSGTHGSCSEVECSFI